MHRNREKKGISTIIAAVFMIAIIILGLGVLTSGLNMQNNLGQVVTERTGLEAEQIKERVEMRDVRVDNNKFNMTLVNTGMLPVKIVRAWVTNTSDTTNGWHTQYDNLNYLINPGGSYIGFGQGLTLTALTTKSYEIKVVTERGTTTTFKILNGADAKLNAQLIAPGAIHPGERMTVTMIVTHNNTLADAVLDIKPPTTLSPVVISGSGTATLKSGPTPTQDPNILRGSTRVYTWTYELTGSVDTVFRFSAQVQGQKSNTATVDVTLTALSITSTDYSTNSGILTMEYTSFRWTQINSWNPGWSIQDTEQTAFKVDLTNNNVTGTLWFSKGSLFLMDRVGSANEFPFYITNITAPGSPDPVITQFDCPGQSPIPPDEYCLKVSSAQSGNNKITLYFAATVPSGGTVQSSGQVDRYAGTFILLGKFCADGLPKTCTGSAYGQNLPFMGLETI